MLKDDSDFDYASAWRGDTAYYPGVCTTDSGDIYTSCTYETEVSDED